MRTTYWNHAYHRKFARSISRQDRDPTACLDFVRHGHVDRRCAPQNESQGREIQLLERWCGHSPMRLAQPRSPRSIFPLDVSRLSSRSNPDEVGSTSQYATEARILSKPRMWNGGVAIGNPSSEASPSVELHCTTATPIDPAKRVGRPSAGRSFRSRRRQSLQAGPTRLWRPPFVHCVLKAHRAEADRPNLRPRSRKAAPGGSMVLHRPGPHEWVR